MIKVLVTDKLAQQGIDLLNSTDGVETVIKTGIGEDELAGIYRRVRRLDNSKRHKSYG